MLMLALPGGTYIYQGDGCRVPLPWRGDTAPFGFSEAGVRTWLPQPEEWRDLTVEAQSKDPQSMLAELRTDAFAWRSSPLACSTSSEAIGCVAWSTSGRATLRSTRVGRSC